MRKINLLMAAIMAATMGMVIMMAATSVTAFAEDGVSSSTSRGGFSAPVETVVEEPAPEPAPEPTPEPEPVVEEPTPEPAPVVEEPTPASEPEPTPAPAVEEKKEETPAPTPVVEEKKEETPAPTPVVEEKKAETTPAPTPVVEEKKAETTPAPTTTPVIEEKKEETPAPTPAPQVEEKKAETTPAPTTTPVVEEKKEETPAPTPAPQVKEKKAESTPASTTPVVEESKEEAPAESSNNDAAPTYSNDDSYVEYVPTIALQTTAQPVSVDQAAEESTVAEKLVASVKKAVKPKAVEEDDNVIEVLGVSRVASVPEDDAIVIEEDEKPLKEQIIGRERNPFVILFLLLALLGLAGIALYLLAVLRKYEVIERKVNEDGEIEETSLKKFFKAEKACEYIRDYLYDNQEYDYSLVLKNKARDGEYEDEDGNVDDKQKVYVVSNDRLLEAILFANDEEIDAIERILGFTEAAAEA